MRRHDGQSVERAGWRSQMTEGVGKAVWYAVFVY